MNVFYVEDQGIVKIGCSFLSTTHIIMFDCGHFLMLMQLLFVWLITIQSKQ